MGCTVSSSHYQSLVFLFYLVGAFLIAAQGAFALVPPSKTFKWTNQGDVQRNFAEYNSRYRISPLSADRFYLCFYNTTPNSFTLAMGMGSPHLEFGIQWVWDANRGRRVKENAVLSFGQDGNLVLTDSDGSVAWQTGTANKGVVDLKLLPNGNLVLIDGKGAFVWQSFSFPSDSLVPGQYLIVNGPNKLTSRVSAMDGSPGPYSFLLGDKNYAFIYTVKGKPLRYYKSSDQQDRTVNMTVIVEEHEEFSDFTTVRLFFNTRDSSSFPHESTHFLGSPKFNGTYSFLRIRSDGALLVYSFWWQLNNPWVITYNILDELYSGVTQCQLPTKCGSLGVCSENMCVGCPQPKVFSAWSNTCKPPPTRCSRSAKYYKVPVPVDHFLSGFNDGIGPVGVDDCRSRCTKDCGCLGFFYNDNTRKCFLAPVLGTLAKVDNTSHVGYIKTA